MLRSVFVCLCLIPVLAGCTSNAQMANAKGQTVQCQTVSFGVIWTLLAAVAQQNCIDDLKKQGFHQVATAAPPPSWTPAGIPAKPQSTQTKQQ